MIKIEVIKSAIKSIRVRSNDMQWLAGGLESKDRSFFAVFNTDLQHIFDSLLDIDNEVHFFDGLYRDYAEYLSGEILRRSGGIRLAPEEESMAVLNKLEHCNE
jgi:hypothetical protein